MLRPGPAAKVPACFRPNLVVQVDIAAAYPTAKYRGPVGPYRDGESGAFLPSGHRLRCHFHDHVVRGFSPDGSLVRALPASVDQGMGRCALAFDGDEHLWVAAPTRHRVAGCAVPGWPPGAVSSREELRGGLSPTGRKRTYLSSAMATTPNGTSPDTRRKSDEASKAGALRLAGESRSTQAAGAATGH